MANKFALLCTPNKQTPAISFALAIKYLSNQCCEKWYALLIPLLQYQQYPSVLPIGSYIRLRDGSIHIVLSLSNEELVTKPLPTKQSIVVPSDKAGIQLTLAAQVMLKYWLWAQYCQCTLRLHLYWSFKTN
jgi:hypothetical protein